MRADKLAEILLQNPDFDVQFSFTEGYFPWPNVRTFDNLGIGDIGYSDKVICLDGNEKD